MTYGLDVVITRGSNTYGPFHHPEKLIPLFVTNALDDLPLPLYGDGLQRRDWLHVADHAGAIAHVLRHGGRGRGLQRPGVRGADQPRGGGAAPGRCSTSPGRSSARSPTGPGHDRRYAMDGGASRRAGLGEPGAASTRGSPRPWPGTAITSGGGARRAAATGTPTTPASTRSASRRRRRRRRTDERQGRPDVPQDPPGKRPGRLMRVAITGAGGRLGRALVAALEEAPFTGPVGPLAWDLPDHDLDEPASCGPPRSARSTRRRRPHGGVDRRRRLRHGSRARPPPERRRGRRPRRGLRAGRGRSRLRLDQRGLRRPSDRRARLRPGTTSLARSTRTAPASAPGRLPRRPRTSATAASRRPRRASPRPRGPSSRIVRTAWLFGPPGNDFPDKILAAAERARAAGEPLRVVGDEIGSPTYAPDLAEAIVELLAARRVRGPPPRRQRRRRLPRRRGPGPSSPPSAWTSRSPRSRCPAGRVRPPSRRGPSSPRPRSRRASRCAHGRRPSPTTCRPSCAGAHRRRGRDRPGLAGAPPRRPRSPDVAWGSVARHGDIRGSFRELWRASAFGALDPRRRRPGRAGLHAGEPLHVVAGVLRGLHLHRRQLDHWIVTEGRALVALVDVRPLVEGTAAAPHRRGPRGSRRRPRSTIPRRRRPRLPRPRAPRARLPRHERVRRHRRARLRLGRPARGGSLADRRRDAGRAPDPLGSRPVEPVPRGARRPPPDRLTRSPLDRAGRSAMVRPRRRPHRTAPDRPSPIRTTRTRDHRRMVRRRVATYGDRPMMSRTMRPGRLRRALAATFPALCWPSSSRPACRAARPPPIPSPPAPAMSPARSTSTRWPTPAVPTPSRRGHLPRPTHGASRWPGKRRRPRRAA